MKIKKEEENLKIDRSAEKFKNKEKTKFKIDPKIIARKHTILFNWKQNMLFFAFIFRLEKKNQTKKKE